MSADLTPPPGIMRTPALSRAEAYVQLARSLVKDLAIPAPLRAALERRYAFESMPAKHDRYAASARMAAADPSEQADLLDELLLGKARVEMFTALLGGGLRDLSDAALDQAVSAARPEYVTAATPVVEAAAAVLTETAPKLPSGPEALDANAVLDKPGSQEAFHAARAALKTVRQAARLYEGAIRRQNDGSTPSGSDLVAVIAIPTIEPQLLSREDASSHDSPEQASARKTVQALTKVYGSSPELALLAVARGAYPGCSVSLAPDLQTAAERMASIAGSNRIEYAAPTAGGTGPGSHYALVRSVHG